jgi:hypothetical protein
VLPSSSSAFAACGEPTAFRLGDVQSIETITFDPRDYGGYGIRSTTKGTAYIARENQGVRLKLKNGSEIVLGSERPSELARVLR